MSNWYYAIGGMASQAFCTGLNTHLGLINPTYIQQYVTGILYLILLLGIWGINKLVLIYKTKKAGNIIC